MTTINRNVLYKSEKEISNNQAAREGVLHFYATGMYGNYAAVEDGETGELVHIWLDQSMYEITFKQEPVGEYNIK